MVLLFLWFGCFNEIAYSSKKNIKSMITKSKRHGTLCQIRDEISISHLKRQSINKKSNLFSIGSSLKLKTKKALWHYSHPTESTSHKALVNHFF